MQGENEYFPTDIAGLTAALQAQRDYTLALYRDLPDALWEPSRVPYLPIINPPLWELAHIAWFAEYFCLRYPQRFPTMPVSRLAAGDALFDSAKVPHAARWNNTYPHREACFAYMREILAAAVEALQTSGPDSRYYFQLALAHEDMHAEALAMSLCALGLPLPDCVPKRGKLPADDADIVFAGGDVLLGDGTRRSFLFDNEKPAQRLVVKPFSISSRVVSATEFAEFQASKAYHQQQLWSAEGWALQQRNLREQEGTLNAELAAIHLNFYQAQAYCASISRRLPTEAEWEFAATHSAAYRQSCGHVWEWTASSFLPYPGFVEDAYKEYSTPWFGNHQVLKGGSFLTHPRLKYPQYRNFYLPERTDMFAGLRTCAI